MQEITSHQDHASSERSQSSLPISPEADAGVIIDSWTLSNRLLYKGGESAALQVIQLLDGVPPESELAWPIRQLLLETYLPRDEEQQSSLDTIATKTHAKIAAVTCRSMVKKCTGTEPAQSATVDRTALRVLYHALSRCDGLEPDTIPSLEAYLILCSVSSLRDQREEAQECAKLAAAFVESDVLKVVAANEAPTTVWHTINPNREGVRLGLHACFKLQSELSIGLFEADPEDGYIRSSTVSDRH